MENAVNAGNAGREVDGVDQVDGVDTGRRRVGASQLRPLSRFLCPALLSPYLTNLAA